MYREELEKLLLQYLSDYRHYIAIGELERAEVLYRSIEFIKSILDTVVVENID